MNRCPAGHALSSPNWCPTCKRTPYGRGEVGTMTAADVAKLYRAMAGACRDIVEERQSEEQERMRRGA